MKCSAIATSTFTGLFASGFDPGATLYLVFLCSCQATLAGVCVCVYRFDRGLTLHFFSSSSSGAALAGVLFSRCSSGFHPGSLWPLAWERTPRLHYTVFFGIHIYIYGDYLRV